MSLAAIEQEFGERLTMVWKSFLLRPVAEPKSLEAFRSYTASWRRPAAMPGAPAFRPWATTNPPPSHSVPPQVALKAAARQKARDRYQLALMNAYFYENRTVTEQETILAVAADCGLDTAAFVGALADPVLEREVVGEHHEAVAAGVTGVPTVVVDDVLPIPGAQDRELYRHVIRKRLGLVEQGGSGGW